MPDDDAADQNPPLDERPEGVVFAPTPGAATWADTPQVVYSGPEWEVHLPDEQRDVVRRIVGVRPAWRAMLAVLLECWSWRSPSRRLDVNETKHS